MTFRFLHTSDWHLGQLFHNHTRQHEHQQFLNWLLQQIAQIQPHALLIAGDIFDVINPSAQAQKQLYQFLADAHALAPHMQTLMIAGNHDSGYRIEQVEPLLQKFNAKTVGVVHWQADKSLNTERLILPIYNQSQQVIAWCVALPFLRNAEITGMNEHTDTSQNAVEYLHQQLIAAAKARLQPHQALILMSHAHLQGAQSSESERPIIIGNEEAFSTQLYDDAIDYVALGHLHKPQKVAREHIRYSGSPIPLSFSELHYKHQVVLVEIDLTQARQPDLQGESQPDLALENPKPSTRVSYTPLIVPRVVELIRMTGHLTELFEQLKALPKGEIDALDARHFIEIEYFSDTPPPLNLRQLLDAALPPNRYRLLRISRKHLAAQGNNCTGSKMDLTPPTPAQLFDQIWQKMQFADDPQVKQDFLTLLHEAEQQQQNESKALAQ